MLLLHRSICEQRSRRVRSVQFKIRSGLKNFSPRRLEAIRGVSSLCTRVVQSLTLRVGTSFLFARSSPISRHDRGDSFRPASYARIPFHSVISEGTDCQKYTWRIVKKRKKKKGKKKDEFKRRWKKSGEKERSIRLQREKV